MKRFAWIAAAFVAPITGSAQEGIDWFSDAQVDLDIDLPNHEVNVLFEEEPVISLSAIVDPNTLESMMDEETAASYLEDDFVAPIQSFFEQEIEAHCLRTLSHATPFLNPERRNQMEALKTSLTQTLLEQWRKNAKARFLLMTTDQVHEERQGWERFATSASGAEWALRTYREWKQQVDGVFAQDEMAQIDHQLLQTRHRRCEALARLMLATMNEHVGLTPSQNEKLLSLASTLLDDLPDDYFRSRNRGQINLHFYQLEYETQELQDLLTAAQWQRWRSVSFEVFGSRSPNVVEPPKHWRFSHPPTPVTAERIVADLVRQATDRVRADCQARMHAEALRITHLFHLSPDITTKLFTRAKGVAEEMATESVSTIEEEIWKSLNLTRLSDILDRIQSHRNLRVTDHFQDLAVPSSWSVVLEALLRPSQRQELEAANLAVAQLHEEAIPRLILTEIENYFLLSTDQRAFLEDRLPKLIQRINPWITRIKGDQWHLDPRFALIPIHLLDAKDRKAIFTEDQLSALNQANDQHRLIQQITQLAQRN